MNIRTSRMYTIAMAIHDLNRDRIAAMPKLLLLFFLAILPLQWTTTAMAAYCLHEETSTAPQHLGHHTHAHPADAAPDTDPSNSNLDADCPSCHTHFVLVAITTASPALPETQDRNALVYRAFLPIPPPNALFRPPRSERA